MAQRAQPAGLPRVAGHVPASAFSSGGATGPLPLRRSRRRTQRSIHRSSATAWPRTMSAASLATPPDDRADVGVPGDRVHVEAGDQAVDVDLVQQRVDVDLLQQRVDVELAQQRVHVDLLDQCVDVEGRRDEVDHPFHGALREQLARGADLVQRVHQPGPAGSAARAVGGVPISSISPSSTSRTTASRITTRAVGRPQNTKIRPISATAAIRSPIRCAYVQVPTGPVLAPLRSPTSRSQPSPAATPCRVRAAVADGPARKAPIATTRPTTSSTRSPCLMNLTSVSNMAAAASLGSTLCGTLFR